MKDFLGVRIDRGLFYPHGEIKILQPKQYLSVIYIILSTCMSHKIFVYCTHIVYDL